MGKPLLSCSCQQAVKFLLNMFITQSFEIECRLLVRMANVFTFDGNDLKLKAGLSIAGATCKLATNSSALQTTLMRWREVDGSSDFEFGLNVLVTKDGSRAHAKPYFRGMDHIVIISLGKSDLFVFDLLRRTVQGVISESISVDASYWDSVLLPIMIGVLGATVGVLPVHCASLSAKGHGVLLAGASGSGKSTLSVALAKSGLDFVSDDWTYVSRDGSRLVAHGMPAKVKLLPDAITFFPELAAKQLGYALNGERSYELFASNDLGLSVRDSCTPECMVFPERHETCRTELIAIPPTQIASYVGRNVERLPKTLTEAIQLRAGVIDELARLKAWIFCYSGSPQVAAQELRRFLMLEQGAVA